MRHREYRPIAGFTLIEVLVAIAIIATLAAAVTPLLIAQRSEQHVTATLNEMDVLSDAIRRFYADTGRLPPVLEALVTLNVPYDDHLADTVISVDGDAANCARPCDPPGIDARDYLGWNGPYIQGGLAGAADSKLNDGWGTPYAYCYVETGGDVNGNNAPDLMCAGSVIKPDRSRSRDAWAMDDGFRLCPLRQTEAVIISYGREHRLRPQLNGVMEFATGTLVPVVDDGTYVAYEPGTRPNAYDGTGVLRMMINDVDNTCLTTGVIDETRAGSGRNFYRTISLSDLSQNKRNVTAQRLDVLGEAVKQYYRDTGVLPVDFAALLSDPLTPGWRGPYMGGHLPVATNQNFLDGWNQAIEYLRVAVSGTTDLHFEAAERNSLYQVLLISRGADLQKNYTGDGGSVASQLVISDDDGDGRDDEDPVDGINNDGDIATDEDPPNTDANARDPFRLVSIRNVDAEKIALTRKQLAVLNEAANRFNLNTVPPGTGFITLDTQEVGSPGTTAVNHLITQGYLGSSYQNDVWGKTMKWNPTPNNFFSLGPDGIVSSDDINP